MKVIFLQIGKKKLFLELIENLLYNFNMWLAQIFGVN